MLKYGVRGGACLKIQSCDGIVIVMNGNHTPDGKFAVGHNLSPGGVRRGESWRSVIMEISEQYPEASPKSNRRLIIEKVFGLARRGVPWAIQWLVERCEGKAPQGLVLASMGGNNPLQGVPDEMLIKMLEHLEEGTLTNPARKVKPVSRSSGTRKLRIKKRT